MPPDGSPISVCGDASIPASVRSGPRRSTRTSPVSFSTCWRWVGTAHRVSRPRPMKTSIVRSLVSGRFYVIRPGVTPTRRSLSSCRFLSSRWRPVPRRRCASSSCRIGMSRVVGRRRDESGSGHTGHARDPGRPARPNLAQSPSGCGSVVAQPPRAVSAIPSRRTASWVAKTAASVRVSMPSLRSIADT